MLALLPTNRIVDKLQNDGQHYSVFSNVLILLIAPQRLKRLIHFATSWRNLGGYANRTGRSFNEVGCKASRVEKRLSSQDHSQSNR